MIELFRRVAALILLVCGAYLFFWPGGEILIVQPETFESGYKRHLKINEKASLSFESYVHSNTAEKKYEVNGEQWKAFADKIFNPEKYPEIKTHSFGFNHMSFAFKPGTQPLASLAPVPVTTHYISVNNATRWLNIRSAYVQDVYTIPDDFLYPHRAAGAGLAICSILLYVILPRKKFPEGAIHYPQISTVIVPDLLGLGLTTFFFTLPFIIVWNNNAYASALSFNGGWGWLTVAMWLLAAVSMMFIRVGLQYSTLHYIISVEGLYEITSGNSRLFKWDEIDFFQSYKDMTSSKIARLLILFGGSFHALGLGMALDGNNETGIRVIRHGGETMKIMANALNEFNDIVRSLKEHGVRRKRMKAPE